MVRSDRATVSSFSQEIGVPSLLFWNMPRDLVSYPSTDQVQTSLASSGFQVVWLLSTAEVTNLVERTMRASSVLFSSNVNCITPGFSNFCLIHWHWSRSLMNINSTPMCWQYAIWRNRKPLVIMPFCLDEPPMVFFSNSAKRFSQWNGSFYLTKTLYFKEDILISSEVPGKQDSVWWVMHVFECGR